MASPFSKSIYPTLPPDLYKLLFINLLININSVYLFMRDFICSRVGRGAGTNLLK